MSRLVVQHAVKAAIRKATIAKAASCHSSLHSFATHVPEVCPEIRTVQARLGHSDVNTTMISTHIRSTTCHQRS